MNKSKIKNIPKKYLYIALSLIVIVGIFLFSSIFDSRNQEKNYLNQTGIKQLKLTPQSLNAGSLSAIVADANSGQVLAVDNANQKLPIASISKVMTAELVYQAIDDGEITLKTKIKIPEYAANLNLDPELSNAKLIANQPYTVEYLLKTMLNDSANDSGIALSDYLSKGDLKEFANSMNKQAKKWGMNNTSFINAVGLNNGYLSKHKIPSKKDDAVNLSTSSDIAILMQQVFLNHPEIINITQQSPNIDFATFNNQSLGYSLIGGKSGSSEEAGGSFAGIAKNQEGINLTIVVLNTGDYTDRTTRYLMAGRYIADSQNHWQAVHFKKGQDLNYQQNLIQTKKATVDLQVAEDQTFWYSKNDQLPVKKNQGLLIPSVNHDVKQIKKNIAFEKFNIAGFKKIKTLNNQIPKLKVSCDTNIQETNFFVKTWREVFN